MLFFVATPIGNLKDISFRAIEVLNSVDEIECEDTRHSIVLLNAYGIKKPLFAYHKFNETEESYKIIEKLKAGKNIAVISDAGMPIVSDPGSILSKLLIKENLDFTIIPGASAFLSALVLSGLSTERFAFIGFLPSKKSEKDTLLNKYKKLDMTLAFYSAPHDVIKDIKSIYDVFGSRRAVAVKEITKIHEKALRFNLQDGIAEDTKGEYVIIVEGYDEKSELTNVTEEEQINNYISSGLDKKEAIKKVAKERGVSKSSLYKYTIEK